MNNHHIIRCSTFALAAVCSTIALGVANAQSPNSAEQPAKPAKSDRKAQATSPLVLPPITVSAGSDTKAPYQTPGGVSVVDGKIVQERYGGDANAIVRGMPGTFTRISSSQPGVLVNIRGFEADGRVNTMIDGVPQTFRNTAGHASTGGELLYIDTNLLAGIGAERGAVNGAYGMGSLAGAVNFRTIDFEDVVLEGQDRGVKTTVKAGSNGYGASGMVAAGARTDLPRGGQASIVGAFSYGEHSNYQRGDGIYNKPDASNKPGSGLVKLHLQPDDVHDLKLGARWYTNDFLVSGYNWGVDNATYTANYKYQPGGDWIDLRINGYYNRTDMSYDPTSGGSYRKRNTRDFGYGFDIANTSRFDITDELSARWDYGAAYSSNDYKVNLFRGANPPGHMQKARAFSDLTLSQGMFELSTGLNYDYWDLSGRQSPCKPNVGFCPPTGGNVDVSRHESALNPKITLSAKPLDWLQPYVTYAHTFRPPSAREALWALVPIGSGVGGGQYSNFFLNPETSKGWEIGTNILRNDVLLGGDELRLKVNYFNNAIDNYIVNNLIRIPGDPYERAIWVNVPGTTHSRGFEVEGGYDAGVAYVNLSYTQASNNQPVGWGAGIGNGDSTFLPESKVTVDVGIREFEEALTVGATMNHVGGSRYAVGFGDTATKEAYTLFNAYASYKFNRNATAFMNIENLTNVAYSPAVSGEMGEKTGRGRTITMGLTTQF
ncbi:hemoglobin/transferrin/lactoferrin receptor protein [Aminobacter lissarensis]|uniref:Hemoglobin/transferrin/lactoferrin receptor protein n=1 Tax=Aminobacter carboxidus TaxID=376165 RepID=A0A8E2BFE1_9HYPH|nr:TonB-dependent receptor [Aminobacter lissarensis]MBB6467815.1 hemoglobin/transferrin/lactoferrin receptor protein [Aminobacter lissarensis]